MIAPSSTGPIFVVGFPRSGTTLLRALLSAHSTIAIAPETHFLNKFAKKLSDRDLKTRDAFDEFWTRFSRSDRFADIGIDADETRDLIVSSGDYHLKNVLRTTLVTFARKAGKPRWGEKTPAHDRHIGTLLEWYPDAKIIYMVRDPRAACASLLQAPWRAKDMSNSRPVSVERMRLLNEDSYFWTRSVDRFRRDWEQDARVMLLKYEELAADPEPAVRACCNFVGAEFEPQMLAKRSVEDLPPAMAKLDNAEHETWRKDHIEKARQGVSRDSVDKWMKELSGPEIGVVEANCHQQMRTLGYDLHDASLSDSVN